jgi:hypothetical protein
VAAQLQPDGVTFAQIPVPAGRYQIVETASSGQVWRVPNELQPLLLDAHSVAVVGTAVGPQGWTIRVH